MMKIKTICINANAQFEEKIYQNYTNTVNPQLNNSSIKLLKSSKFTKNYILKDRNKAQFSYNKINMQFEELCVKIKTFFSGKLEKALNQIGNLTPGLSIEEYRNLTQFLYFLLTLINKNLDVNTNIFTSILEQQQKSI